MKPHILLSGRAIKAIACLTIFSAPFILLSFKSRSILPDVWSRLGISESVGSNNIKKSFLEGYMYSYGASSAKKIAVGDRVAVAMDILNYTKTFVTSQQFKKEYDVHRESRKPQKPNEPKTKQQIQKERIDELNKALAENDKAIQNVPNDMKASMREVQNVLKEQLKQYEDPNNELLIMMAEGEKMSYESALQNYKLSLSKWESEYPEDHKLMLKARLEKFIQLAESVDFNAALKEVNGKQKFVNPEYERKPSEWKAAYRAGKPVIDAAKNFAKQWVSELK